MLEYLPLLFATDRHLIVRTFAASCSSADGTRVPVKDAHALAHQTCLSLFPICTRQPRPVSATRAQPVGLLVLWQLGEGTADGQDIFTNVRSRCDRFGCLNRRVEGACMNLGWLRDAELMGVVLFRPVKTVSRFFPCLRCCDKGNECGETGRRLVSLSPLCLTGNEAYSLQARVLPLSLSSPQKSDVLTQLIMSL